jgi:hypothetical protein
VISFAHGDAACVTSDGPSVVAIVVSVLLVWREVAMSRVGVVEPHRVVMCDFDTHTARMDLTFSLAERWSEAGEPPGSAGRWSVAPTCSMRPASKR